MITNTIDGIFYKNFEESADYSLTMLSKFLDVDELLILASTEDKVKVIKVYSNDKPIIPNGVYLTHSEDFYNIMQMNAFKPFVTMDTHSNPVTDYMDITRIYGVNAFLCVPIISRTGELLGSLMAISRKPFEFNEHHLSLVNLIITGLTYVLDLEIQVITDQLTGAYTRSYLSRYFTQWKLIEEEKQLITNLAFIYCDFDGFKEVNDKFGHEAGDYLLAEKVAQMNAQLPNNNDFITRLGGDEFLVVTHYNNQDELLKTGKSIVSAVSSPCIYEGNELRVSISAGVALHPKDGETIKELIKKADDKMYQVKTNGKNNIIF